MNEGHVNSLGLCTASFTFVTCPRVRDKGTAEVLGSPAPSMRRKRRLQRQRLSSGQTLGSHTHKGGCGRCSHVFGVVRTDAHAHTQAQTASTGPQTPGYVARRDEVSFGESALGSHTRPGGLISSTRLGLHWAGIFHGSSLAGWGGRNQ